MNYSPEDFAPIDPKVEKTFIKFMNQVPYPKLLGMVLEEIREGYSRMRLPYKPELIQAAGIVHGGATASLIDTAVVGAIFAGAKETPERAVTVDMHIHYLSAVKDEDMIAHARVRRRGKRMIYLEVEVVSESGREIAHGELAYMVMAGESLKGTPSNKPA